MLFPESLFVGHDFKWVSLRVRNMATASSQPTRISEKGFLDHIRQNGTVLIFFYGRILSLLSLHCRNVQQLSWCAMKGFSCIHEVTAVTGIACERRIWGDDTKCIPGTAASLPIVFAAGSSTCAACAAGTFSNSTGVCTTCDA
jgi:hypothetical protein